MLGLLSCAGVLVDVLRSALELGIQPGNATLKALLACCADLESRPGKSPLGLASGPGFELAQVGYVDLGRVLQACRDAVDQHHEQQQGSAVASAGAGSSESSSQGLAAAAASTQAMGAAGGPNIREGSSSLDARQLAAQLLRTCVFNSTFDYVKGVGAHGPTWALRGATGSAEGTAEVSAAVGA
jgi:hypothetical protein